LCGRVWHVYDAPRRRVFVDMYRALAQAGCPPRLLRGFAIPQVDAWEQLHGPAWRARLALRRRASLAPGCAPPLRGHKSREAVGAVQKLLEGELEPRDELPAEHAGSAFSLESLFAPAEKPRDGEEAALAHLQERLQPLQPLLDAKQTLRSESTADDSTPTRVAAALTLHCVLRVRPLASEKEGEESDRAGSAEGAVETEQGESLAAAGDGGEARRRRLPRPRPSRERSVQTALGEGEEGEGGEPSLGAGLKRKAGAAGLPPGAVPAAVAEAEAMEVEQAGVVSEEPAAQEPAAEVPAAEEAAAEAGLTAEEAASCLSEIAVELAVVEPYVNHDGASSPRRA